MEKTKKKSDPWARSGERPGRVHGSELFFFCFFGFSMVFCSLAKTSRTPKKKQKKNQTHGQGLGYPHTNQKTKKTKNQETKKPKKQKNKKPKKQKNKKYKKNKKTRPNTLHLTPSPWGVQSCFFFVFLVFWFFGFLFFWCFGLCVESTDLAHGSELFVFFFLFSRFWPNCKNPWKNQKTKKPRNQKTKKQKKKQDCTPQGEGVRCRVLGLVFLFFLFFLFFCFFVFLVFCFFGLDSHCRCAKQRLPGTVSGCTRSKVDTLQYSNVCYDIVHSANEQQRGMEFNFVRLRHMLLDLCTGNAAICALPQWPVLFFFGWQFPRSSFF